MKIITDLENTILSDDRTIGFGEIELDLEVNEKSQRVLLTVDVLESMVKILQAMDIDVVTMQVESDKPLFFTSTPDYDDKPHPLKGLLVAPRVY